MFKDFNNTDREIIRHNHNPASRTHQEEFLKSDGEIAAEFTYHSYAADTEVGKICPESVTFSLSRRRIEDPVRLYMHLEATDSLEENY